MSSGSAGHDPKFTSFDPNALADGRRLNESPAPGKPQHAPNMKKKNEEGASRATKNKKNKKEKKSKTTKPVGLSLNHNAELDH